ncbi:MAG: polyprenyl synthetase family protein [Pseudomonadales bacterium]|nr:polyprenyl synthetase family protein [Pseudomonadales bacterium]
MSDLLQPYRSRIEAVLDKALTGSGTPDRLSEAMRYAVLGGGKRIRAALVYLASESLGAPLALADSAAAAIEMVHAYSLVHDDLPSMDDDDLRRGRPTCHIAFSESTAILAGDALQALAYETIAADDALPSAVRLDLVRQLAHASGPRGMVGGQVIDLESENRTIDPQDLVHMHRRKTGDLISTSVTFGAIIAGAAPAVAEALRAYGYALGLAFQVRDDILDEIGDTAVIGKTAGSDQHRRKSTFVSLHGLDGAQARLESLRSEAIDALAPLGAGRGKLVALADFVADRNH